MIEESLKNLKGRSGEDSELNLEIERRFAEYQESVLKGKVLEMEPIKWILDYCKDEVESIDNKLISKYSKDLSDNERDRLLDKKSLFLWFANFFKPIDEKELKSWIKEQSDYLKTLGH